MYTIFKREGIWEDFTHSYAEMFKIFSAWKGGDLLHWQTLPVQIGPRETCRKLEAFLLFFFRSQGFLRWTLEPRVASADVAVYESTASCYSFYGK